MKNKIKNLRIIIKINILDFFPRKKLVRILNSNKELQKIFNIDKIISIFKFLEKINLKTDIMKIFDSIIEKNTQEIKKEEYRCFLEFIYNNKNNLIDLVIKKNNLIYHSLFLKCIQICNKLEIYFDDFSFIEKNLTILKKNINKIKTLCFMNIPYIDNNIIRFLKIVNWDNLNKFILPYGTISEIYSDNSNNDNKILEFKNKNYIKFLKEINKILRFKNLKISELCCYSFLDNQEFINEFLIFIEYCKKAINLEISFILYNKIDLNFYENFLMKFSCIKSLHIITDIYFSDLINCLKERLINLEELYITIKNEPVQNIINNKYFIYLKNLKKFEIVIFFDEDGIIFLNYLLHQNRYLKNIFFCEYFLMGENHIEENHEDLINFINYINKLDNLESVILMNNLFFNNENLLLKINNKSLKKIYIQDNNFLLGNNKELFKNQCPNCLILENLE